MKHQFLHMSWGHTERPITCEMGTNVIVGNDKEKILEAAQKVLRGEAGKGRIPEKWDGKAAERIVEVLLSKAIPTKRGF